MWLLLLYRTTSALPWLRRRRRVDGVEKCTSFVVDHLTLGFDRCAHRFTSSFSFWLQSLDAFAFFFCYRPRRWWFFFSSGSNKKTNDVGVEDPSGASRRRRGQRRHRWRQKRRDAADADRWRRPHQSNHGLSVIFFKVIRAACVDGSIEIKKKKLGKKNSVTKKLGKTKTRVPLTVGRVPKLGNGFFFLKKWEFFFLQSHRFRQFRHFFFRFQLEGRSTFFFVVVFFCELEDGDQNDFAIRLPEGKEGMGEVVVSQKKMPKKKEFRAASRQSGRRRTLRKWPDLFVSLFFLQIFFVRLFFPPFFCLATSRRFHSLCIFSDRTERNRQSLFFLFFFKKKTNFINSFPSKSESFKEEEKKRNRATHRRRKSNTHKIGWKKKM